MGEEYESFNRIPEETSAEINKAFNMLNVHNGALPNRQSKTANKRINEIIEKAKEERPGEVIDEYGIFHPENLTEEEIAEIKSITEETYFGKKTALSSGLENETSAVLIKSIPADQPVYKQSVYNLFKTLQACRPHALH